MAGGKSTRFGSEKLISNLCGKKVIDFTISAMKSLFPNFYVAVSDNAPETKEYIDKLGLNSIRTPGNGYPRDVKYIQDYFSDDLLILNGDSIFVTPEHIRYFLSKYEGKSQTAITYHKGMKIYIGLNIATVNSLNDIEILLNFENIYLNINTKDDLAEANLKCKKLFGSR